MFFFYENIYYYKLVRMEVDVRYARFVMLKWRSTAIQLLCLGLLLCLLKRGVITHQAAASHKPDPLCECEHVSEWVLSNQSLMWTFLADSRVSYLKSLFICLFFNLMTYINILSYVKSHIFVPSFVFFWKSVILFTILISENHNALCQQIILRPRSN